MILDFISIIISTEQNLDFFRTIGFEETDREVRPDNHDIVVWMKGNGMELKIFIDSTHPSRVTNPEAYGLRHLSISTTDIEKLHDSLKKYNPDPIKETNNKRFFFVRDPDNCPFRFGEA